MQTTTINTNLFESMLETQKENITKTIKGLAEFGITVERLKSFESYNQVAQEIDDATCFKIYQRLEHYFTELTFVDSWMNSQEDRVEFFEFGGVICDAVHDAIFNLAVMLRTSYAKSDLFYINPASAYEVHRIFQDDDTPYGNFIKFLEENELWVTDFIFKIADTTVHFYALNDIELGMYYRSQSGFPSHMLVGNCFKRSIPELFDLLEDEFFENIGRAREDVYNELFKTELTEILSL